MRKLHSTELYHPTTGKNPVCILLDHIRSLHNVGSAFRTADAFNVEKIYLSGITGQPPHREIQKTALGATESVCWHYVKNAVEWVHILKKKGYYIIAVEQTTKSIPLHTLTIKPYTKYCLIFGNEVNGVSDDLLTLADKIIEIPQSGIKHSLNVSVCLGIVMWYFYQKIEYHSETTN